MFEDLKRYLTEMKQNHWFINTEYLLDNYGKDATCYNYIIDVFWKIEEYNFKILKERYGR